MALVRCLLSGLLELKPRILEYQNIELQLNLRLGTSSSCWTSLLSQRLKLFNLMPGPSHTTLG